MGGSFTSDGCFEILLAGHAGWGPYRGRTAIVERLAAIMARQTGQRRHCITNLVFRELDASRALVESYRLLTAVQDGKLTATRSSR